MGWRNRYFETGFPGWMRPGGYGEPGTDADPELAKRFLKARMESLQAELDEVKQRLAENDKTNAVE